MAHFAEIDENSIVTRVLVVSNDLEDRGAEFLSVDLNLGGTWIKTSYNGKIRKNFAGIGYSYDSNRDAFIPIKCHEIAILDEDICQWICSDPSHVIVTDEAITE
jgi:hypothetical protein